MSPTASQDDDRKDECTFIHYADIWKQFLQDYTEYAPEICVLLQDTRDVMDTSETILESCRYQIHDIQVLMRILRLQRNHMASLRGNLARERKEFEERMRARKQMREFLRFEGDEDSGAGFTLQDM